MTFEDEWCPAQSWRGTLLRRRAAGVCRGESTCSCVFNDTCMAFCFNMHLLSLRFSQTGPCCVPHVSELVETPRPCRSEGRDGWGRSYFVEVTTSQPMQPRPAALQAPSVPLLFGLAVLFGAYFSAVATFLRNFHLTR